MSAVPLELLGDGVDDLVAAQAGEPDPEARFELTAAGLAVLLAELELEAARVRRLREVADVRRRLRLAEGRPRR